MHDLTPAADLLHGEEAVIYANAGYLGIENRDEMRGWGIGFRVVKQGCLKVVSSLVLQWRNAYGRPTFP